MRRTTLFSSLMFLSLTTVILGDIRLPALISDNMVLQQKEAARIWGWADPGERVSVSFHSAKQKASAVADEQGRWSVDISVPKAGGPYELTIEGKNSITLKNVMVGEVWICSGQSNMEMAITKSPWSLGVFNWEKEIAQADYPQVRMFTVQRTIATEPLEDVTGQWKICSPENAPWFSATAYFFGRELYLKLGIPVGLIHSSWGGTPAEAWTSREKLHELGDHEEALNIEWLELTDENKTKYDAIAREREKIRFMMDATNLGYEKGYADPAFDDSDWGEMEIPCNWENARVDSLKNFDGVVWFRKTIEIPAEILGPDAELRLGKIDDTDVTYVNGVRLGGLSYGTPAYWMADRKYFVPGGFLRPGKNTIAVRVFDDGGAGGLTAKPQNMWIASKNNPSVRAPLTGTWKYKVEQDFGALTTRLPDQNTPTMLYNGMIAPVVPYRLRGAIWYQGESNHANGCGYRKLFPRMIRDWRARWDCGDFPFYFVQIAPFNYDIMDASAELREAQLMTLSEQNTGMAVTWDISTPDDIHPRNKQDVGKRLAYWALSNTYDKRKEAYSGPLYKAMRVQGDKIRVYFSHDAGGLVAKEGPLREFEIAGKDRVFYQADAIIEGRTVVVSSPAVKKPAAVRFGWSNAPDPNLFNEAGLPASPFRTDDWPGVSCSGKGPLPKRGDLGQTKVAVHINDIVNDHYLGLGVQWSAYPWWEVSDADWQKLYNRLDYMKMSLSRVIVMAFYYTKQIDENGEPVYDWNTPVMKRYYRLLDWCQRNNCKVMFGEWGPPRGGNLDLDMPDPTWTRLAVDCTRQMLDKGYTCIKWYNLVNEPHGWWSKVTREDWIVGMKNLYAELKKQKLYPQITIAAPDADLKWTHLQLEDPELRELTGIYDEHWYIWNKDVLNGNIERWARFQRTAIDEQDPGKDYILGELGLMDGKTQDDKQPNVRNFWYGISMADAAIQTIRGGIDGVIAWDLDDAMHYFGDGDNREEALEGQHSADVNNHFKVWGFWNILGEEFFNRPEEERMRPWFYSWSVLTRNFPAGCRIVKVDPTGRKNVRATAATFDVDGKSHLTIAAVNNSEEKHDLLIHVPGLEGKATFACFEYFDRNDDNRVDAWPNSVDENGNDLFPEPTKMITDVIPADGITITLPPKGFVLLTTLEGGTLKK